MVEERRNAIYHAAEVATKLPENEGIILREWIRKIDMATREPKQAEAGAKLLTAVAGYAEVGTPFMYFSRPADERIRLTFGEIEGIAKGIDLRSLTKTLMQLKKRKLEESKK